MSKFRPYSRRILRAQFWAWCGQNCRLLTTISVATLTTFAAMTLFFKWWPSPIRWYVLGFAQAALLGAMTLTICLSFFASSPDGIRHLRGAWGEDNTRSELQRAKRKRVIWGWVDSVNLQAGDIDHLVLTRQGGLVAIDSKWRTTAVTDPAEMSRAALKVRLRAEGVARTLLPGDHGTHRATTNPLSVLPLVVLWGPAQRQLPDGARHNRIEFVAGKELVRWLQKVDGLSIDEDAAADLLRRLHAFRASAWTPNADDNAATSRRV